MAISTDDVTSKKKNASRSLTAEEVTRPSVYPGAKIFDETHIQICVLNTKYVLGYFVPTQIEKYFFKK